MTTAHAKTAISPGRFRLPDPLQREADEATQYDQLFKTGNSLLLAMHFGNPDTTLVEADRWMIAHPSDDRSRYLQPDLMVAFDADPAAYAANNGYVVAEPGKPPDFVLEVASASTAETDTGAKREACAALGILKYWRFDQTGEFYGARLAGDRLVAEAYQPIPTVEVANGSLEGYSAALNLYLRWEQGELIFYDPATGRPIASFGSERARADAELTARVAAETRADTAEARIRELEGRLYNTDL